MSVSAEAHAMFEQLFRGISEPYAALAADAPTFTILAANDAFVRAVERSREELEGHGFFEVFGSSSQPDQPDQADQAGELGELGELRQAFERLAEEGGSASIEAVRLGEQRLWSTRETAITNDSGQITYILHRVEEVDEAPSHAPDLQDGPASEQLSDQRELPSLEQRAREQFFDIFMRAPALIAIVEGPDHVYTLNNPVHDELLGHRELIGRTVGEIFEDIHGATVDKLDRVFRTGEIYSGEEHLLRVPDLDTGEVRERYINVAYLPMRDLDGEVEGIAIIGWEVTELIEARKLVERQAERLRQESALKDEFLAMLGHELRNPLAPLATVAQVLQLQGDDVEPARVAWAAEIIDRQVRQLSGLVDDLLDVARITEGRIELERSRVRLREIIDAAVDTVEPLVERSRQTLELDVPDDTVVVDVDRTRLIQVLSNLLHNATKYTPEAGRLRCATRVDGDDLILVVEDTGQGIDPEILPHVFDLFRQSDKSLARTRGGLGLGLTLVRRLVEMHGGSVCAISDGPGEGSRFEVCLPVVCPDAASQSSPVNA